MTAFIPLTEGQVPSAWRLSTQAGWNQSEEDWRRLVRVSPGGVRVRVMEGEVRAAFSVVAYPPGLAWIGMILVDEHYRGGGLGKLTFQAALECCRELGCETVGLDATDMGEPIYRKYGFVATGPVTRWGGTLCGGSVHNPSDDDPALPLSELIEHGRRVTGVDRSLLFRHLLESDGELIAPAAHPGSFGIIRPGRTAFHLGPVLAENSLAFAAILDAPLLRGKAIYCDLIGERDDTLLRAREVRPLRYLKRMYLGENHRFPEMNAASQNWCGAGFEWG